MTNAVDSRMSKTYVVKCSVYFDDLDTYGMLYNGRYVALVDRGFYAYAAKMGWLFGHEDLNQVIREIKLTFGEPIRRVGEVDLVFWTTKSSRSSATFEFVIKSGDTEHARGHQTVTKIDPATGRSKPWSAEVADFVTPATAIAPGD